MGSINQSPEVKGIIRYSIPDLSITPDQRSLFGLTCNKSIHEHNLPLHNFRSSPNITRGPEGLDVQGFTYINHESAVSNWDEEGVLEEIYFPETVDLVKRVTGASKAIVLNSVMRRKVADAQKDPNMVHWKDGPLDQAFRKQRKDVPMLAGMESPEKSLEPLRNAHMDYTLEGLRATARYARKDVRSLCQKALDAEDRGEKDRPRYAAYSIWRPMRLVHRDALAVLDTRTLNTSTEIQKASYRALSEITSSGDFVTTACVLLPPEDPARHHWYWMPEQRPDEVLFIKLADTKEDVAGGCGHCAPRVEGEEGREARWSIETRVLAVWD